MCLAHTVIATDQCRERYRFGCGERGIPTGTMFHWSDGFSICPGVLLNRTMHNQLLGGGRVLAIRQACEVLFVHASRQTELIRQLAMPFSNRAVVLLPIVLFRRREFSGMVLLRLRGGQRLGYGQHD